MRSDIYFVVEVVNASRRDTAWGRFFLKRGAVRVLREAEDAKPNGERIAHWRIRMIGVPIEHTLPKRMRK